MKVSQAVNFWLNYHRANSSKNTIRAYKELMERFCQVSGDKDLKELTSDDVLDFLNGITESKKPQTRKTRFSHLTSFFNFTKNNIDQSFQNPCDNPIIKKMFRAKALAAWDIPRAAKRRNSYSFLKRLPIGLKIISGKMEYTVKIAFFRYAMKLPDQWLKRLEMWLVFI